MRPMRRFSVLLMSLLLVSCIPNPFNPNAVPTAAPTSQAVQVPTTQLVPTAAQPAAIASTAGAPTAQAASVAPSGELAAIAAAQPQPRDQTILKEDFTGTTIPMVARTTPLEVKVGDVESFWVADAANNTNYQIKARLRYAGPVVLMYVDTEVDSTITQSDIEASAKRFEQEIYLRDRAIFGSERSPGVDGDPRLTVLNTAVRGAGGYFSSADGVTKAVNRFSNEREMFVIGINSYPIGSDEYASTLAHEFQHMIEYNVAERSPSWFNEGMSTLAEDLNGFVDQLGVQMHIDKPDIQLTAWDADSATTGRHYATSRLFMRYIYEQYGGDAAVKQLVAADAGDNLEVFGKLAQAKHADMTSFADVVAAWAVANAINNSKVADGRYAYKLLPSVVTPEPTKAADQTDVAQYGADYLELPAGPTALRFNGATTVGLTDAPPRSDPHVWWSNRGDDSVQTLTRAVDLSSVNSAKLQFAAWYEIERNYDYAFVSASTDNGKTWTTLKGTTTTNEDPQGANFGNGFTGVSGSADANIDSGTAGQWLDETVDLTPYAGKQILLRFWMISDAALNGAGLMIDNIRIPAIHFADDAEAGDTGWQASGFVRTTGVLPQQWTLRMIRSGPAGVSVETVPTDQQGRAGVVLKQGERGTLVVVGSTPFTTERARYSYTVEQR